MPAKGLCPFSWHARDAGASNDTIARRGWTRVVSMLMEAWGRLTACVNETQ